MVDGADAVRLTDCAELYVPPGGDAVTVSGDMIVYTAELIEPEIPKLSFAKNFSVALVLIVIPDTGLGPLGLDTVGTEPSVV